MRDCDIQPLIADTVRSCRCIRNSSGVFAAASRLRRCILVSAGAHCMREDSAAGIYLVAGSRLMRNPTINQHPTGG